MLLKILFVALLVTFVTTQQDGVVIVQFGNLSVSVSDTAQPDTPILDGATLRASARNIGLFTYVIDANSSLTPQEFCDELSDDPDILLCVPDQTFSIDQAITPVPAVSDDPLSGQQWGLSAVGVPDGAWLQGITGIKDVRVCIMDSGIDLTHPDLQPNIWVNPNEILNNGIDDDQNGVVDDMNGASFLSGVSSNKVQDQNGHGIELNIE